METYYREKIKETRNKQGIKGLTSLNINRERLKYIATTPKSLLDPNISIKIKLY